MEVIMEMMERAQERLEDWFDAWWPALTEWWGEVTGRTMTRTEFFYSGHIVAVATASKVRGHVSTSIRLEDELGDADGDPRPQSTWTVNDICDAVLAYQEARDWLDRF
jgi:hypothetical protein